MGKIAPIPIGSRVMIKKRELRVQRSSFKHHTCRHYDRYNITFRCLLERYIIEGDMTDIKLRADYATFENYT